MGKGLVVSDAKVHEALDLLAEGMSFRAVAALFGVTRITLHAAIQRHPETQAKYQYAREIQADEEADEIKDIADKEPDVNRAKVRVDVRKWRAAKLRPKIYGEKLDLNVTQTADITGALAEARARSRPGCDQQDAVDAEVIEVKSNSEPSTADSESVARPDEDIFT